MVYLLPHRLSVPRLHMAHVKLARHVAAHAHVLALFSRRCVVCNVAAEVLANRRRRPMLRTASGLDTATATGVQAEA